MQPFERDAVIAGIGISEVGRRLERDPWTLTAHAALAAIADAGLDVDAIDGIATYPGGSWHNPGLTGAGVFDVARLLGIDSHWHSGGGEGASQLGSVFDAAMAVSSGTRRATCCASDQFGNPPIRSVSNARRSPPTPSRVKRRPTRTIAAATSR